MTPEQIKQRAEWLAKAEAANTAGDAKAFDDAMAAVDKIDADAKAEQEAADAAATRAARLAQAGAQRPARTVQAGAVDVPRAPQISAVRDLAAENPTRGFANLGHFAAEIMRACTPGAGGPSALLAPLSAGQGMNQAVGSEGGFLVPQQFSDQIWDGLNQANQSLYGMCDQYPVDGDSLTFPANAETSRANGSRYGGVRAYWLSEAAQIAKSQPKFRQVKLEPQGLAALVYVTDKLLRNARAMDAYLTRAATDEISFVVGDAIVNGDGVGKPLGLLASNSLVTVSKEAGQANGTILQANISKMFARLHPRCRANAVWLHNVDIEPQLDALSTPVKNVAGTENVGGIGNNVWSAESRLLKGRPLMPIEYCPSIGSKGDLILVDLKSYAVGLRSAIESAVSMHLRFDYAEQAFRFIFEIDGQPWLKDPLTPYRGSNTLSSHVALEAR